MPGGLPFGKKKNTTRQTLASNKHATNVRWECERSDLRQKMEWRRQQRNRKRQCPRQRKALATYGELVQLSFNWRLLSMDVSTSVCQNPESLTLTTTAT